MAKRFTLQVRLVLGVLALVLPPLAIIAFGTGALLFQREALSLEATRLWLLVTAAIGAGALAVLFSGHSAGWISWRWMALLALPALVPIGTAVYVADWVRRHPSLSEISTDLTDPPAMNNAAIALRPGAADAQPRLAPKIKSLTLKQPPAEAFAVVRSLVDAMGWTVTRASAADGVLEGRFSFGRFGYGREWVLRIRPELGGGSLVDMRLRSRPGEPDFGQNAELVDGFLRRLAAEAS